MSASPPFDPPYLTRQHTAHALQVIETRTDGTTRIVPEHELRQSRRPARQVRPPAPHKSKAPAPVSVPDQKMALQAQGNGRAILFLEVPFGDKESVKRLGARWDAALRKWYVPHGVDIHLFSQWWPPVLKTEMKRFGQL